MRTPTRGFTLIEMLVAILILAIMAAMAYRGLNVVLDTQRRLDAENELWRGYALAFTQIGQDLNMAVPRSIRDGSDQIEPALLGKETYLNDDDAQLIFTVMGDPALPRAQNDLRRVGYRLRNGKLEYLVWPSADLAPGVRPRVVSLLDNVEKLQFRYLDDARQWLPTWPVAPTDSAASLPRGVEVTLQSRHQAPITRVFALP